MPSTISAGTTAGTAIAIAGDTTGNLAFQTNGTTTAMTITTSQNVGIGTSSPSFSVDVLGGSGNNTMRLRNTGGSTTLRIDTDTDSASNRNWAFRNRYNAFGRLELMRGTTNSDDPLTTTMYWNNDGSTYVNGDFYFNSGYGGAAIAYGCRAWVNFNGTGTVAIRGSGNVSSITDNGTGAYAVNFTTAMPDANYGANVSTSSVPGTSDANFITTDCNNTALVAPTTTSFAMTVFRFQSPPIDAAYVRVSVFR